MSEMTEERIKGWTDFVQTHKLQGIHMPYITIEAIEELVNDNIRLREAAKGQAIIADQAAARIRELEKQNHQLMMQKIERDERIHEYDQWFKQASGNVSRLERQNQKMKEALEWIRDEGSDYWSIRKAQNILNELEEGK